MRDFDRGTGVLVALHGHGDEPSSARDWGRRLAPVGWEVVAPGARRGVDGVRSWFDTGPRGADESSLRASAARVAELVGQLRGDGRRVVVAGFSQGAALAAALGVAGVQPDGVVLCCGFLADTGADDWLGALGASARSGPAAPPTLVLSAEDDDVVPPFLGEDLAALLAQQDRPVVSAVLPGGHGVSPAMVERARAWIAALERGAVRVSLGLPVDRVDTGAELVSGDAVTELAAAYERLGFDAAYVTDHPAPDARWLDGGGHHALEPTVALAVAAAATRRLLLHTNVYVLPYRNPFLAAKALASLDVLSAGRLILGVAAGYLRPEFAALGAGFDDRTHRLEEALALLPRIWGDEQVAGEGSGYDAAGVLARPRPAQRPHPPIWVGGNSAAALRRAVTLAQGWSPFPTPGGLERAVRTTAIGDLDELSRRLVRARELCEELGRTEPLTICFVPFSLGGYLADPERGLAPLVEEVEALEGLGVDWVALSVPGLTRSEVRDRAAGLAAGLRLS